MKTCTKFLCFLLFLILNTYAEGTITYSLKQRKMQCCRDNANERVQFVETNNMDTCKEACNNRDDCQNFGIATNHWQACLLCTGCTSPTTTAHAQAYDTYEKVLEPTSDPTSEPTKNPTFEPTSDPTSQPTSNPTFEPTSEPTKNPTSQPTSEPTKDPTSEPTPQETTYPDVKIVDIDSSDFSLTTLKTSCGSGYRPVSIQSAAHVIWLSNKVEQLKGKTYLTQGKGIPLGYDYNQNNQYWDLNDQTRSVQAIFDKLRTDHSWGGDYQSDQTNGQQWYAGFGWNYHGIEDWGPTRHPTSAIICEKETSTYIYTGDLIAGKTITANEIYPGSSTELANDGKTNGGVYNGNDPVCTITGSEQTHSEPTWIVIDLEQEYNLHSIVLVGRSDCCPTQSNGWTIRVGHLGTTQDSICLSNVDAWGGDEKTFNVECTGRYIRIESSIWMTLCEISAFGVPNIVVSRFFINTNVDKDNHSCPSGFNVITDHQTCIEACIALSETSKFPNYDLNRNCESDVNHYPNGKLCVGMYTNSQAKWFNMWTSNDLSNPSWDTTYVCVEELNLEQFLVAEVEENTRVNADYWRSKCTIIPSTALYITVQMGTIIDYFKPIDGATFCDMLQSRTKHMWSPDGLSWEQPVYFGYHVGGSAQNWIKDKDGRNYISFWGTDDRQRRGGCCHYSTNDGTNTVDGALWNRKFNMYYYIDAIPTVIIPTEKYLLVGDGKCNSDNEIGGDFVTASPEDCRSHCIEHYETYFAMWTRAHDGASICTCYHDCDTQDSTDNSLVYEILSEHVFQLFADAKALLDHRDGQIDTLNSEISRLNSVIEEKNRIIADKDVEIAEKNDKIAALEASLTSEKAKKIKWKSRYEHVKTGVTNEFTEAEETYQSEQAIGRKSGGGAKNSTWFRSMAQVTLIMGLGIAMGVILSTRTKMVADERVSLL